MAKFIDYDCNPITSPYNVTCSGPFLRGPLCEKNLGPEEETQ